MRELGQTELSMPTTISNSFLRQGALNNLSGFNLKSVGKKILTIWVQIDTNSRKIQM